MCLAIPACVVELREGDRALVDVGGVRKEISLVLVENVAVGDYVILHVGYALQVIDPAEARRTLELFATGDSPRGQTPGTVPGSERGA